MIQFFNCFGRKRKYQNIGDGFYHYSIIDDYDQFLSYCNLWRHSTAWNKFGIIVYILCIVATALCTPIYVVIFGRVCESFIQFTSNTENLINEKEREKYKTLLHEEVYDLSVGTILLGIVSLSLNYISGIIWSRISVKQIIKIRQRTLEKILNQDVRWFDDYRIEEFSHKFSRNLEKMEDGISKKNPAFLYYEVVFLSGIILSSLMGWQLTLICVVTLSACLLLRESILKVTKLYSRSDFESHESTRNRATEVISAIPTVIAFGGQKKEVQRFRDHMNCVKKNNIKSYVFIGLGEFFSYFFLFSCCGLTAWFGIRLICEGRILHSPLVEYNDGSIITILYTTWIACWNFYIALPLLQNIILEPTRSVFARIHSISKINYSLTYGLKPVKCLGHVTFTKVFFNRPCQPSLSIPNAISFTIQPGETIALVGGGLACFHLLLRLYDPTHGRIVIDGNNLKDLNLTEWRKRIALVESNPILFDTTISENIRYGRLDACQADIEDAAKGARIHNLIKILPKGYNTKIGENLCCLSEEQKWRVALARSLLRKPSLLLIDATSSYWVNFQAERKLGFRMFTWKCTCIILVDHPDSVSGATQILAFPEGKIEIRGSHQNTMGNLECTDSIVGTETDAIELQRGDTFFDDNWISNVQVRNFRKNILKEENHIKGVLSILKMSSPEWPWLVLVALCSLIKGTLVCLTTIVLAAIIGNIYIQKSVLFLEVVEPFCWQFVTIGFMYGSAHLIQMYAMGVSKENLSFRLTTNLFKCILEQEMDWFDKKKNCVEVICNKLTSDVAQVSKLPGELIDMMISTLTILTVSNVVSFYLQNKLWMLMVLFTPVDILISASACKIKIGREKAKKSMLGRSNEIANEAVKKIKTLCIYGLEKVYLEKFSRELAAHSKTCEREIHMEACYNAISNSMLPFACAVGFLYGTILIFNLGVSYKTIIMVIQLQIYASWALRQLFKFWPNVLFGVEAVKEIMDIVHRVPLIGSISNASRRKLKEENIEFTNVNFTPSTQKQGSILRGVNLEISSGKTVALTGPKDSGPNIILKLLERFYNVDRGEIKVDEVDISIMDLGHLRSHFGILSGKPDILDRTIAENISYGDNSRITPMDEIIFAAKRANIHDFIISLPLGYATVVGFKGHLLSMSQKQRIAIARNFLRNPKILLLDEPIDMLNHEYEKIIQDALTKLIVNRTCVVTTSHPSIIENADLIYYLHRGLLIEAGTHHELLNKRGYYYKLYKSQEVTAILKKL